MPLRVRQELLIMKIKIEEQTLEGHALNHYRIERMKQCQTLNAVAKEIKGESFVKSIVACR